MNGLFKLVVVEDGANLAVAVAGPVGLHDLHLGVAHVRPDNMTLSHPPVSSLSSSSRHVCNFDNVRKENAIIGEGLHTFCTQYKLSPPKIRTQSSKDLHRDYTDICPNFSWRQLTLNLYLSYIAFTCLMLLLLLGLVGVGVQVRELGLPLDRGVGGLVPVLQIEHLLPGPLQHVTPHPATLLPSLC